MLLKHSTYIYIEFIYCVDLIVILNMEQEIILILNNKLTIQMALMVLERELLLQGEEEVVLGEVDGVVQQGEVF